MSEVHSGAQTPPAPHPAPPASAGALLRDRREGAGLDLEEVARRTRVPLRHLRAIEASDYGSLPSVTYAVGFARAYARAVGADEVAVAADVRREVDRVGRQRPEYEPYVTADPARVPSRGLAAVTAGLALAVIVLAVLWFTTDLFRGIGTGPGAAPAVVASVPDAVPVQPAPAPAAPANLVRLTANDEVWVRVYDAADRTLKLGTMQPGEVFEVPAGTEGARLTVGRPDKLAITLDNRAVPPLGTGARPVQGASLAPAALAARLDGAPAATPPAAAPVRAPARAAPRPSDGAQVAAPGDDADVAPPSADAAPAGAEPRP